MLLLCLSLYAESAPWTELIQVSTLFPESYVAAIERRSLSVLVSEDATTAFIEGGLGPPNRTRFGWYTADLRTGEMGTRNLFKFKYAPSKALVLYDISQSKLVLGSKAAWSPAHDRRSQTLDAPVLAAFTKERIAVGSPGPMINPPGSRSVFLAGIVDTVARGENPNQTAQRMISGLSATTVLPSVKLEDGQLRIAVLAWYNKLLRLTLNLKRMRLTVASAPANLPKSLDPIVAYDWSSGKLLYGGPHYMKSPAEWNGKKATNVALPPQAPMQTYYSHGRLYCVSRNGSSFSLFEASANRKSWKDLGPYLVWGRSASDKYWLVQRYPDRKFFLARFKSPA